MAPKIEDIAFLLLETLRSSNTYDEFRKHFVVVHGDDKLKNQNWKQWFQSFIQQIFTKDKCSSGFNRNIDVGHLLNGYQSHSQDGQDQICSQLLAPRMLRVFEPNNNINNFEDATLDTFCSQILHKENETIGVIESHINELINFIKQYSQSDSFSYKSFVQIKVTINILEKKKKRLMDDGFKGFNSPDIDLCKRTKSVSSELNKLKNSLGSKEYLKKSSPTYVVPYKSFKQLKDTVNILRKTKKNHLDNGFKGFDYPDIDLCKRTKSVSSELNKLKNSLDSKEYLKKSSPTYVTSNKSFEQLKNSVNDLHKKNKKLLDVEFEGLNPLDLVKNKDHAIATNNLTVKPGEKQDALKLNKSVDSLTSSKNNIKKSEQMSPDFEDSKVKKSFRRINHSEVTKHKLEAQKNSNQAKDVEPSEISSYRRKYLSRNCKLRTNKMKKQSAKKNSKNKIFKSESKNDIYKEISFLSVDMTLNNVLFKKT